jgi:hypothetical protein
MPIRMGIRGAEIDSRWPGRAEIEMTTKKIRGAEQKWLGM